MKQLIRAILILIIMLALSPKLYAQQLNIPLNEWKEVKPETEITTTIKEFIKGGWTNNFSDIADQYPGGISYKENRKKRIAGSYNLVANLADINAKATIIYHKPIMQMSSGQHKQFIVKRLSIQLDNDKEYGKFIQNIKNILMHEFPSGGPTTKGPEEIGYFIPRNNNCGDIIIDWSHKKGDSFNVLILVAQCH